MNKLVLAALTATTLVSAPVLAQTQFEWHPGRSAQLDRVERWHAHAADRVARRIAAATERAIRQLERSAERARRLAERQQRTADRIHARVASRARSIVDTHMAASTWALAVDQGAFDNDPCGNTGRRDRDDFYTHCEVRDTDLPAGALAVDARPNGSIRVEAWDGSGIRIRAIVQAHARTQDEAKQLAGQVQVQAGGGRVSASGPDSSERDRHEWWSVSYRVNVPRQTDLELHSVNGSNRHHRRERYPAL